MEKPSLPKGTRDFGPAQMAKRQFILNNILFVFQKYGFMPLETPAMENLSTLTGKYGDEGDQLLFKILDSGDYQRNLVDSESFKNSLKSSMIEQQTSRKLFDIFYGLEIAVEAISLEVFKKLSDDQRRDPKEICKVIESDAIDFILIGVPTKYPVKNQLKDFIKQNAIPIANSLIDFYERANVYPINYERKHEKQFYQYISNILIPYFAGPLMDFLLIENLESLRGIPAKQVTPEISEKGLRYDLTVPFARYVVMNRGEITLPFKRYQIQPVWRADRPQKGRYREFFQCDADVVGTDSLVNEAEIVLMIKEVFGLLQIKDFTIKINHRGVLSGLAETAGAKGNEGPLFVAIDKLDKIGEDKVAEELHAKGFTDDNIKQVFETLKTTGSNSEKIQKLSARFTNSESGKKGLNDLTEVFNLLQNFGSTETNVEFDISLARGLSYYTGPIFEVKVNNVSIGSVSGGGRYDNLTQAFGSKERLSGVGISFGIDRIYDVMEELNLFPKEAIQFTKVLIVHMEEESMKFGMRVAQSLRFNNISTEIYPEISKVKKQLDYANKKQIPFAVIIGPDEMAAGQVALKNLITGSQESLDLHALIEKLK